MAKPSSPDSKLAREPGSEALPIGPRVEAVLEVAYRARRPVLLEGATGIGKSELVAELAKKLGIAHTVLDLSLLEPPDLVGLPVIEEGRTRYALPRFLPRDGAGILMLEELNRAERYIQQPALQLLTARSLHEYTLPPGWACFAAINPESGDYHVTPLDAALRARFLQLPVRADRASWLAWAGAHGVHPAIIALARAHERIFENVPPRSFTYAGQVLANMSAQELADPALVRDVLSGYLPQIWVSALANGSLGTSDLDIDVHALLSDYKGQLKKERSDKLDEVSARLKGLLGGPECGVLIAKGAIKLSALEALLADLPGDLREQLQEALGHNPTAVGLIDLKPDDVLTNEAGSSAFKRIEEWKTQPLKGHRIALLVTALRARITQAPVALELRKSNAARVSLGHLLLQLGERWGLPLAEALHKVGVTPVRPGA
ncbi:MAG TPA: MoxR family ATPase [Polyangiales bacterium]|nr:MoxR family ATPase [Polyangiales bacterium]